MCVLSFVFAQNSSYHLLGTTHDSKHRNYMYIAVTHIESKSFMVTSKKLILNKIQYMFQSIHDRVLCRIQVTKLYSLCSRFCDRCVFYLSILWCSRMIILHVAVRAPRSYKHSHGQNEVRLFHIPFLWYSSRRKNIWHNRHEVILLVLNIVFYFCHMWKVPCVINVKSPYIAPNF